MPAARRRRAPPPLLLLVPVMMMTAGIGAHARASDAGHPVGTRIEVRVGDLPAPYASPSTSNPPTSAPRPPDPALTVPPGFTATLFAANVANARNLLVLPGGDVLVAQQQSDRLALLHGRTGDGRAAATIPYADGFSEPFGLAFHDGAIYVADLDGVWRLPWRDGAVTAADDRRRITPPGALGDDTGHSTRSLVFSPDGQRFYVGIGSRGNLGEEDAPRATVQEFAADGRPLRTFASGLRNPIGLAFRPGSEDLYTVVNERDGLGDRLVPDYLTRLTSGAFYGWPYAYLGPHPQPGFADRRPDRVRAATMPDLLFEAHSAPITLTFAEAAHFPDRWRHGAFVALHGSWNRHDPTGYDVVFVPFAGDRPAGGYEVFATGFRVPGPGTRAHVWGRPAGLAIGADGSLLIADDHGTIWRIAYTGG